MLKYFRIAFHLSISLLICRNSALVIALINGSFSFVRANSEFRCGYLYFSYFAVYYTGDEIMNTFIFMVRHWVSMNKRKESPIEFRDVWWKSDTLISLFNRPNFHNFQLGSVQFLV